VIAGWLSGAIPPASTSGCSGGVDATRPPGEGADIATTMIYVHDVPRHDAAAKLSTALRVAASPAIDEMEESAVDRGAR